MPGTDKDWARAFARQALSDLKIRDLLETQGVEKCHRLHFLQMAAEKACKAYLIDTNGFASIRRSHAYVAKHLLIIARQAYSSSKAGAGISRGHLAQIKQMTREIELLAPACDENGQRNDNSEYPWIDHKGDVQVPCSFTFPNIDTGARSIRTLVKLIQFAALKYAS